MRLLVPAWCLLRGEPSQKVAPTSGVVRAAPAVPAAFANASLGGLANASIPAQAVLPLAPQQWRQTLVNYENTQYYGAISVGGQVLEGIFDTGSFDLLVLSARCKTCARHGYDHTKSTTYAPATTEDALSSYHFGSGPALTVQGFEKVTFGPYAVARMPMYEIVDHEIPPLDSSQLDAIVGIGPGEEDRSGVHVSMLDVLGITRFSVCLLQGDSEPGYITWQDADPVPLPQFKEVQVDGKVHWGVSMMNVAVGSETFACQTGCGAVVDSGTSLIAAPRTVLASLDSALSTLKPDCSNMASMPTLKFNLGGQPVELPPQAYIARMVGVLPPDIWDILTFRPATKVVMQCVPLLMELETMQTPLGPLWILGMPFFRYYYTTFTRVPHRKIHIAHAGPGCTPSATPAAGNMSGVMPMLLHTGAQAPLTVNASSLRVPNVRPDWTEASF